MVPRPIVPPFYRFLLLCFDDDQHSLPGLITASFLLQYHLSVPEHVEKLVSELRHIIRRWMLKLRSCMFLTLPVAPRQPGAGGDVEKPLIPEDDRSPLESLSSRMYKIRMLGSLCNSLEGKRGRGGSHKRKSRLRLHEVQYCLPLLKQ